MSYRLTSLIIRVAQCPCPQKIVLAVIADMADDDGMCWPSLETIALRAGMTRRSVIDQVEKLEAAGLLSVSRGGRSNKYQIVLPSEPRSQVKDVHMCTTFTRPVNDVHQTSEPRSPQVVNDVHPKLSVKQSMKGSEKPPQTAAAEGKERTTSGKRNYGPEPEACAVTLPAGTDPELADAWSEWQTYRQRRAAAPGRQRIAWTAQGARLSAKQVLQYSASHGSRIVSDRIATAIQSEWQGLNLDKLATHQQNGNHSRPNKPSSRNGEGFSLSEERRAWLNSDKLDGPESHRD